MWALLPATFSKLETPGHPPTCWCGRLRGRFAAGRLLFGANDADETSALPVRIWQLGTGWLSRCTLPVAAQRAYWRRRLLPPNKKIFPKEENPCQFCLTTLSKSHCEKDVVKVGFLKGEGLRKGQIKVTRKSKKKSKKIGDNQPHANCPNFGF